MGKGGGGGVFFFFLPFLFVDLSAEVDVEANNHQSGLQALGSCDNVWVPHVTRMWGWDLKMALDWVAWSQACSFPEFLAPDLITSAIFNGVKPIHRHRSLHMHVQNPVLESSKTSKLHHTNNRWVSVVQSHENILKTGHRTHSWIPPTIETPLPQPYQQWEGRTSDLHWIWGGRRKESIASEIRRGGQGESEFHPSVTAFPA